MERRLQEPEEEFRRAHEEAAPLGGILPERDTHIKVLDETIEERDAQLAQLKARAATSSSSNARRLP